MDTILNSKGEKAEVASFFKNDEEFAKAIHNIAEPLTQGGGAENE